MYYNTTNESGEKLKEYKKKALTQKAGDNGSYELRSIGFNNKGENVYYICVCLRNS